MPSRRIELRGQLLLILAAVALALGAAALWSTSQAPRAGGQPEPSGPLSPLCGSNAVLLCRGGPEQGEPCSVDDDCPQGICTRMGHPRRCRVRVFCNVSNNVPCSDNMDCPLYPFANPDDWCPTGVVASKDCENDADCGPGGECIDGIAQCEYEAPRLSWGRTGDLVGDWVIGQCSLEDGVYNAPTSSSLATAVGIEFDPAPPRRLYVADFFRVTGFEGRAIDRSQAAATVVIGQATFERRIDHVGHRLPGDLTVGGFYSAGPRTLLRQFDRAAKAVSTEDMEALWITDVKRVGRYPRRVASNAAMELVLGDRDFGGTRAPSIEAQIEHASDIDAQRRCTSGERIGVPCRSDRDCPRSACTTTLVVADCGYHRVAVWRQPPRRNGERPDLCLGQLDCSQTLANRGGPPQADTLNCPRSVAFDSKGNLWVLDAHNHRVLRYHRDFTQENHRAGLVFGQQGFEAAVPGRSDRHITIGEAPGAGIDLDHQDNLAIADTGNGRVLFVPPPYDRATRVIGAPNFTEVISALSTDGTRCDRLASPRDVAFDDQGNLWVADSNNGRALRFPPDFPPFDAAAEVIQGQISCGVYHYLHVSATSFGRGHGHGAAVRRSPPLAGLGCFGDSPNHRILCWRDVVAARSGMPPADFVIGQQAFDTFLPNRPVRSASTLDHPMLFDFVDGEVPRLVVADRNNHRVLGYRLATLKTGAAADLVLGQHGSFETAKCGAGEAVSAETLCEPTSARGDSEGNIWVADHGSGRVLLFCFGSSGTASGVCTRENAGDAIADLVLGKPDLSTGASVGSYCSSPSASTLCRPYDVLSDPRRGRVIVSDRNPEILGSRVLIYEYPLSNGMPASKVIGIPGKRFDTYEPSKYGACWGGEGEGRECNYVEPAGARPGSGPKTCVAGRRAHQPCTVAEDCPGGTCGCPAPGICDYARSLAAVTPVDALALHPELDVLYVGKGPHILEYRGPLESGMRAERAGGFTVPHNFHAGSTGYTECQWDRLGGGMAFDADHHLYVAQGGAEDFTAVLIVADPAAALRQQALAPR